MQGVDFVCSDDFGQSSLDSERPRVQDLPKHHLATRRLMEISLNHHVATTFRERCT